MISFNQYTFLKNLRAFIVVIRRSRDRTTWKAWQVQVALMVPVPIYCSK